MDELILVEAAAPYRDQIAAYRAEFPLDRARVTLNPSRIPGMDGLESFESVDDWLRACREMAGKITWYMTVRKRDGKIVGFVCFRHRLEYDDDDAEFASHIGYSIRPSEHGKGYGREQLRLALEKAREWGLAQVRLVCSASNIYSAKIIQSNGGVFVDAIYGEESGLTVNRYDIHL